MSYELSNETWVILSFQFVAYFYTQLCALKNKQRPSPHSSPPQKNQVRLIC